MAIFDKQLIGNNVKQLREAIGLSMLNFSHLTDISLRTLANIESGISNNNLDTLAKILAFYDLKIEDLVNRKIIISQNFRKELLKRHVKNKELLNLLHLRPTVVYAIKYNLLKSDFLDKPKEIAEVKDYFEKLGWSFLGTSISNALKRMPDLIEIRKHATKGNTNVYIKRP